MRFTSKQASAQGVRSSGRSWSFIAVRTSVVVAALVAASACTPTAGSGPGLNTPGRTDTGDGPAPKGEQEGDSAAELRARIDRLTAEQDAQAAKASADKATCQDVCSLTASICEASQKLCKIADRQPQDDSYQDLCREGQLECREATDHCERCVGGHASEPKSAESPPPAE